MSVSTVKDWISILENSYVLYAMHPWSLNINKQMVKSPKIYFYDTGLLCYLLNIRDIIGLKQHFAFGSIFENFVINEIIKSQLNRGKRAQVYFLRDSRGHEIDCIVPSNSSSQGYYEIKSGATFSSDFVKNIEYYKAKGTVIYRGENSFNFKNARIICLEEFLSSIGEI